MTEEAIPFNKIGSDKPETLADLAEREGITEAQWRAQNLPASLLEFRWRYGNRKIFLLERRLRSLREFNVGPAVQAWVRSRLEWVADNRFYDMPDGVIVLTIDPEGAVEIQQDKLEAPSAFDDASVEAGARLGTRWYAKDGTVYCETEPKLAADTFVRDLVTTLGYDLEQGVPESLDGAEIFAISDEFGIVPCEGTQGQLTQKLVECFDKLWAQMK